MLKICKNMQNIQNMHSCFKNAALCISAVRLSADPPPPLFPFVMLYYMATMGFFLSVIIDSYIILN